MAATLLASAAVKEVISKLASLGWQGVELLWDFKEDLEDMDQTLSILQAVLLDAQKQSLENGAIRLWLGHLKDAAYDIEDMMDDFLVQSQHWRRDKFFRKLRRFLSLSNPLILRGSMAHKLKKMREKLNKIAEKRSKFLLKEETTLDKQEIIRNRATFSEVNESVVCGRKQDKEMIIKLLLDENHKEDVSVIPIVGIGGLGKTTLAQLVYNDKRIKDQSNFNLRAWVYVSMEFDLKKLAGDLLSDLLRKNDHKPVIRTLQDAIKYVGETVAGKKYLIVLDDVWTEIVKDCDNLKLMLKGGARGSKIVVTTRSENVAELMRTVQPYLLRPLSEDDCWKLFKSKAFHPADKENEHQRLMEIGKEIAKKCGGVPLAVNALGSMMRFKRRENSWIAIRDSEMLELHKDKNWSEDTILDSLKLSYCNMPPQLKLCFSYCSIFPKGQEIDKDKLIQQWIALGFIKTTQQHQHLTRAVDIGEECIDNLRGMSFLQDFDNYFERVTCKMHDLVHDLAKFVGGSEFMTVNNNSMGAHANVKSYRYTTLAGDMEPSMIYKVVSKKVRALHLRMSSLEEIPKQLFSVIENVRVLDLSGCNSIDNIPTSINKLKQLRYLDASSFELHDLPEFTSDHLNLQILYLSNFFIKKIPKTIGKLQHLQHLDLSLCLSLRSLPESIVMLQSLQHLDLSDCYELEELPVDIGKLVQLQHLNLSSCRALKKLPQSICNLVNLETLDLRSCHKLRDLPRGLGTLSSVMLVDFDGEEIPMRDVRQRELEKTYIVEDGCWKSISIVEGQQYFSASCVCLELHGVSDPSDALIASLRQNATLKLLILSWSIYKWVWSSDGVLEQLLPPPNLFVLQLRSYSGYRFPNWMMDGIHLRLPNLIEMALCDINECDRLPPLGLLPHLKILTLTGMYLIKSMGEEFYGGEQMKSLEELHLWNMRNLEDWLTIISGDDQTSGTIMFPCLKFLEIMCCPCLRPRPCIPTSVVRLDLYDSDEVLSSWDPVSSSSSSLEELSISKCNKITRLPDGMRHLQSLQTLRIQDCTELAESPEWLGELASLTNLEIGSCHKLKSLPEGMRHLQSLQTLRIQDCKELAELPEWLGELASLTNLEIRSCDKLKSLPEGMRHLQSLQTLRIQDCKELAELPEWLGELASLTNLEIRSCDKLKSLPEGMRHLQSLQTLRIQDCTELAESPEWLGELASLTNLKIR